MNSRQIFNKNPLLAKFEMYNVKKNVRTIVLGQIVLDTIIRKSSIDKNLDMKPERLKLGGPPSFAGFVGEFLSKIFSWVSPPLVYAYTCPEALVLQKSFPRFKSILKNMKERTQCPHFQLIYNTNESQRTMFLENPPLLFNPKDYNWDFEDLPIAIVGSVFHEFDSIDVFNFLRKKCSYISFDPQGCFRQIKGKKKVIYRNWNTPEIISKIDCLKISEVESKFLNFGENSIQILKRLLNTSIYHVLLTRGEKGTLFGVRNRNTNSLHIYDVPAFTEGEVIDETGAGDVFLYSFVLHYCTHYDDIDAVAFATSIASLLIEGKVESGLISTNEVLDRQKKVKSRITEI